MNLTPQQLATQQIIVQRSHPGLSLQEANMKDMYTGDAMLIISYNMGTGRDPDTHTDEVENYSINGDNIFFSCEDRHSEISLQEFEEYLVEGDYEDGDNMIIGLPPCLARVLNALGKSYYYHNHYGLIYKEYDLDTYTDGKNCIISRSKEICHRMLNDDGTPANLWDQSQETQEAIHNILVKSDSPNSQSD